MKPKGIEYDRKRTKYACFKACQESEQMLPFCDLHENTNNYTLQKDILS
jgi:hypothetical protein